MTIILIGNKCDLSHRRVVSYHEGEQFAKEHGLLFMEASAKTAHNVEKAFILAARTVHKKIEDGVINLSDEVSFQLLAFSYIEEFNVLVCTLEPASIVA
uniref:Uncharacterized protein n=1 Tax=Oryza glumipatula TaxID=40148 RepID=A0A0E0B8U0_9ORYZ